MSRNFLIIVLLALVSGCGMREREAALEKREAALRQKEQELVYREQALLLKQQAMTDSLKLVDSLRRDTLSMRDPRVVGTWNIRMVCTQTNCSGSAVGDTQNQVWELLYEGNFLVARSKDGDKLVRVYTGELSNGEIILDAANAGEQEAFSKMQVRLNVISEKSLEGTREIVRDNCRVLYSVKASR